MKSLILVLSLLFTAATTFAISPMEERFTLNCDGLRNAESQRLLGSAQQLECSAMNGQIIQCSIGTRAVVPKAKFSYSALKVVEVKKNITVLADNATLVFLNTKERTAQMALQSGLFQICR